MALIQHICGLIFLGFVCHGAVLQGGGRNDGEPDYNPGFMELRDGGRNDGEPDYDPTFLEFRSEDYDDEVKVPDSVWQNEANHTRSHPHLMLMPENLKGKL